MQKKFCGKPTVDKFFFFKAVPFYTPLKWHAKTTHPLSWVYLLARSDEPLSRKTCYSELAY